MSQTIVGGIAAGAFIITFSWTFLTPVLNKDAEIAERTAELLDLENILERARLDSLNRALTAQKEELESQVQLIAVRLDSTRKRKEAELALANQRLRDERAKSQQDKKRLAALNEQVASLEDDIKRAQSEKAQIKKITTSSYLSTSDVKRMLQKNNYYDRNLNPGGAGVSNKLNASTGGIVVYDAATGLSWQQSGSPEPLTFGEAQRYIDQLNGDKHGGYSDWRLPTLEEAMSLMEPKKRSNGLYVDPVFDKRQQWIWTSDRHSASRAWYVFFLQWLLHQQRLRPHLLRSCSTLRAIIGPLGL